MSRLGELIEELCPNGVEYVPLRSISAITIGEFVHKSKQSPDSEYPVYNGGIANTGYYNLFNNFENKIIVSARGANAGFVNRVTTKFWAGNSCYTISIIDEKKVDWNFIYYYLKSSEYNLINMQQRASIPSVSLQQMQSMLVPNPPIEVQREIVRILDNFTELTAELTAELKKRKSQYEFYKNYLLIEQNNDNFINKIEYKKIKDVFTRIKGTPITAGKMKEIQNLYGDIKIFAGGKTEINAFEEDIPRANITRCPAVLVQSRGIIDVIFYDEPFTFKNEMWAYTNDNIVTTKYLYYILRNNVNHFRQIAASMGSFPQISLPVT